MGYTGKIPGSYWIWRPTASQVSDAWMTLVSAFESGAEQRRAKWGRPLATLRFQFTHPALNQNDLADIWRFYQKQQGRLRTFEVPTYGRLTTVASSYPGSGTSVGLSDTQDLTTSATSRWNRLWLENAAGTYEAFTINSVTTATRIEVAAGSNSGTVFAIGDAVYPLLKVRFTQQIFGQEYLPVLLGTVGIEFTEVTS